MSNNITESTTNSITSNNTNSTIGETINWVENNKITRSTLLGNNILLATKNLVIDDLKTNEYYATLASHTDLATSGSKTYMNVSYTKANTDGTTANSMYGVYKRLLKLSSLPFGTSDLAIISFNREVFKYGIDLTPNSNVWDIMYKDGSSKYLKISDMNNTYQAYKLMDVTGGTTLTNTIKGYLWAELGVIIIEWSGTPNQAGESKHYTLAKNFLQTSTSGVWSSGDSNWTKLKNSVINKTRTYFVRILNNKYNKSINPTWVASTAKIDGITYITGVGLYSGNTLMAIAKLDKPLKKNNELEYNLQIKIGL